LEIIALACEPVPKKDDGTTDRTIEEVRQQAIQRGTVGDISWSSVQRLLAGADIHPHHVEGWLHSIDPEFREAGRGSTNAMATDSSSKTTRWPRSSALRSGPSETTPT